MGGRADMRAISTEPFLTLHAMTCCANQSWGKFQEQTYNTNIPGLFNNFLASAVVLNWLV